MKIPIVVVTWFFSMQLLGATFLVSPKPGSLLSTTTHVFEWQPVSGATTYWLYLGTSPGERNIYSASSGTLTSVSVSGIPANGSIMCARVWYYVNAVWAYTDFSFRAPLPNITTLVPYPGETLAPSGQVLSWNPVANATDYWVYLSDSIGGSERMNRSVGPAVSVALPDLPVDLRNVYVRIWYRIGTLWKYQDFVYRTADSVTGTGFLKRVTLAWNPVLDDGLAGYRVYYGPIGSFTTMVDVGNVTTVELGGFARGVRHNFYATSYNFAGLESEPSNIVAETL